MFGEKKKHAHLVGAKEKIAKARALHKSRDGTVVSKKEGKESGPFVALIVIYSFCLILTTLLMEGVFKGGLSFRTGFGAFDQFFFGASIPRVTGTKDIDYGIVLGLRAGLMMLVAGFVPFVTFVWQRLLDQRAANLYFAFWGTIVGLPMFVILIKDFLGPIFTELFDLFLR